MAGKFEVKKAAGGKFHFVLKAGNGEVILQSLLFDQADAALKGVQSVRASAASEASFERKVSKSDEPYFSLKGADGHIVGRSEMYSSVRARDNGIESVMKNAPDAKLDDQTNAA